MPTRTLNGQKYETHEHYISFQSHGNLPAAVTAFTLLGILSASFCSHSGALVRSNIYVASEVLARSVQACQDSFTTHNKPLLYGAAFTQRDTVRVKLWFFEG